jgi:hypothetical protein
MRLRSGYEPSGSKIHRFWRCTASAILPQDTNEDRDAKHEPARGRGKDVHRFLERIGQLRAEQPDGQLAERRDKALSELPRSVATGNPVHDRIYMLCAALDLERLPAHLATEVAYCWDVLTGDVRELGRNLGHRDYHLLENPPSETEVPFTLDAIGAASIPLPTGRTIRRGYVGDYKLGHTRYPRPGDFGQTLLGAIGIRRLHNLDEVVVELIFIDEDGDHYTVRDNLDSWDLDTFERELGGAFDSIPQLEADYQAGRGLPLHEGPHCAHCNAYKHCDAKTALMRAMPAELVRLGMRQGGNAELEFTPGAITRRNAAVMYQALEAIEALIKRGKAEICEMGYQEPIPLDDGRIIEPRETRRRSISGPVAATVLQARWGPEEVKKRIELKCSLDALRDACIARKGPKDKLETRRKDGMLDLLVAEIERAGGVGESVSRDCKPYMPRGKKKAPK